MQRLKIVFSGPMGAGKTQAISSLSDIPVVSTEVMNTDLDTNAKLLTTVGMDYGELTIDGGASIGLYGTPGQERFNFIWPILSQGALGVVILIDHSAPDSVADLAHYLKTFDSIYDGRIVLGISQVDKMPEREFSIYRDYLASIGRNLPLFPVDMRKREDVLLLVESIIASLEQSE
ncbi:GTP-binding protein [Moraxella bovis]|uniref:ATP/GTP-binding protein n=1 Tax=Moraxella bovis TaxID=476 RepID=A0A1T0AAD4_MORBO|nr:ATP/GTP-binding protein [Moraxella bovis]AWY19656.1 GTP-binding protein [Moraxella bovis]OOR92241.1 GTP-binding protein [Moraxella bovis]UYZ67982.1 ATP/GTP-binding protein [Moraxella bovis]UYZ70357.1 ATP/GTP-binding protein [Moraxella bovis]UYZ73733.1 ATP/GTP-binding protein [Moraxella bovis]